MVRGFLVFKPKYLYTAGGFSDSEMQLVVRKGETGPDEWFMIEMQGDLESRNKEQVQGKFIGDLHFNKQGIRSHCFWNSSLCWLFKLSGS
jgi:hypothetical protein